MTFDDSISHWIDRAKAGNERAIQRLWERYFSRLVQLANKKLQEKNYRFRVADGEDVALSAFKSFWKGIAGKRFPRLDDRDALWRLFVVITARKASDYAAHDRAGKRGGGRVGGESVFAGSQEDDYRGIASIISNEPTPEFAALVAEEYEKLLVGLGDDTLRKIAVWKMEGLTNDEIAARLSVARRTVARKVSLIRSRLKKQARRPGGDTASGSAENS